MKCPKCNYVSHDYLDACRKCGRDLADFKLEIGLAVLQPGVLDLGLVLGGAEADDLFAGMDEEVTMHAGEDDDFDISLDDYTTQPLTRRGPLGVVRTEDRDGDNVLAGMDHLTLELDSPELPAGLSEQLRAAAAPPPAPSGPVLPASLRPGAITLPGHLTVEMDRESLAAQLPSSFLTMPPLTPPPAPPRTVPQVPTAPEAPGALSGSLQLDIGHLSESQTRPIVRGPQTGPPAEPDMTSGEVTIPLSDITRARLSIEVEDAILAEEARPSQDTVVPDALMAMTPPVSLADVTRPLPLRAAAPAAPEAEETPNIEDISLEEPYELTLDDAVTIEAATGDIAPPATGPGVPPMLSLEGPGLGDSAVLPSFEFDLDTLVESDPLASQTAISMFDNPDLALESGPLAVPDPSAESTSSAERFRASDVFALETLATPDLPGHLTLNVPLSSLPELDAPRLPPAVPTASDEPSESLMADLSADEALVFPGSDGGAPSGHLTLTLDGPQASGEISASFDVSSLLIDTLQLESPVQQPSVSTPLTEEGTSDEDELLLDLDNLIFDDEDEV